LERHRIAIVIPALNEADTIGEIVTSAARYGLPIVIDDGSTDQTSKIASNSGAEVVRHTTNLGYDSALNSGFQHAQKLDCEYIVTMDADGQHDPSILDDFIQELDNNADLVVGIRDRVQRVTERLFSRISYSKWKIRDPLCGMKAYRMRLYKDLGHFDSYESIGTELMIFGVKHSYHTAQIPVKTRNRKDASRLGNRLSSNIKILRALIFGVIS